MGSIKLIMSDIDGTILPAGKKHVSDRTLAAFRAAREAGLLIGPASGRSSHQIPGFFAGDASCCATCIGANGLEVYLDGECIGRNLPPRASLERLLEVVRGIPHAGIVAFDGTTPVLCCGAREDLVLASPAYAEQAEDRAGLPDCEIVKINSFINADMDGTIEFCAMLNREVEGLDFDVPSPGFTNTMPAGWNKGAALKFLCEQAGVSPEDVVVFGDAGNDLTMFRVAGHPTAVANATPDAAAAARWHIGACADDAVAATIEAIIEGVWPPAADGRA